ncbi:MAG: hypothetical protein ABJA66_08575 [Actinomycetota bacterium]
MLIAIPFLTKNKPMTENEKYLKEAQTRVKEFETEMEAERLREASMALENVNLAQEYDSKTRSRLRKDCLYLWLTLLQLLDQHIDPKFNADDLPTNLVQPPSLSNGVVLRPGADPAKIDDPKLRAEYEKAIAENRAKAENYRLQTQLRRLNESIPPKAEEFIRNSYSSAASDQEELKTAIEKIITKPERKEDLSKLLKPLES